MNFKNINLVPAILMGVSAIAIILAVILFATYRGAGSRSDETAEIILWGTISQDKFNSVIQELSTEDDAFRKIIYFQKNPVSYEDELLKAIAEGTGPDLVLLNETQIISNQRRIQEIPYDSFPLRTYQDLFLDESKLLLTRTGILGFPFIVDPLVMYYNKDILNNNGFARPPETWTEILSIVPTLTNKDSSFNISRSAVALGSFDNITNAKQIYWTLTLQAGNPVTQRYFDEQNQIEKYSITLHDDLNFSLNPGYAATNFFVQFSNPTKTIYSWNKSLPSSQTAFVSGDLAFYFGFASELSNIRRINPNLNFDVALMPQSQSASRKLTYGKMDIFAIPRTSRNVTGAVNAISKLTSIKAQKAFVTALGVPSVRRDLVSTYGVASSYEEVFNRSAIIAQGILEPDSSSSSVIIKELIDTVVSGQYEITQALTRATQKLNATLYE